MSGTCNASGGIPGIVTSNKKYDIIPEPVYIYNVNVCMWEDLARKSGSTDTRGQTARPNVDWTKLSLP